MTEKKVRGKGHDYGEVKKPINLSITPTAKALLTKKAVERGCKSLSDFMEKLARGELNWD